MQPIFVLVHSPSVGPSTWHPVAEQLAAAGHQVRVPSLLHVGGRRTTVLAPDRQRRP